MRLFFLWMLLTLGTPAGLCQIGPKKAKPVVNQQERDAAYRQLFTTLFYKWDHNQDGKVDVRAMNRPSPSCSVAICSVKTRTRPMG
jgi:hypothetical protein